MYSAEAAHSAQVRGAYLGAPLGSPANPGENFAAARPELAADSLRRAHDALGEITGRVLPDALLGHIFATFCIGK